MAWPATPRSAAQVHFRGALCGAPRKRDVV